MAFAVLNDFNIVAETLVTVETPMTRSSIAKTLPIRYERALTLTDAAIGAGLLAEVSVTQERGRPAHRYMLDAERAKTMGLFDEQRHGLRLRYFRQHFPEHTVPVDMLRTEEVVALAVYVASRYPDASERTYPLGLVLTNAPEHWAQRGEAWVLDHVAGAWLDFGVVHCEFDGHEEWLIGITADAARQVEDVLMVSGFETAQEFSEHYGWRW